MEQRRVLQTQVLWLLSGAAKNTPLQEFIASAPSGHVPLCNTLHVVLLLTSHIRTYYVPSRVHCSVHPTGWARMYSYDCIQTQHVLLCSNTNNNKNYMCYLAFKWLLAYYGFHGSFPLSHFIFISNLYRWEQYQCIVSFKNTQAFVALFLGDNFSHFLSKTKTNIKCNVTKRII